MREALRLGEGKVRPHHLLIALGGHGDEEVIGVLGRAGLAPNQLVEQVLALRSEPPEAIDARTLLRILADGGPAADLLRAHGVDEAAVVDLLGD